MTFLNFSQLSESVFRPNFPVKHFPENQAKFSFDWKVFSVEQLSQMQTNTGKFEK
jgi:cytolysin (calcineurin-like family phosphatase)